MGSDPAWNSSRSPTARLMASDVFALMDALHIGKATLVGWSDGGIIGLDIAIHHPERLTKLFAFGANSAPSAIKDDIHGRVTDETDYFRLADIPQTGRNPANMVVLNAEDGKVITTLPIGMGTDGALFNPKTMEANRQINLVIRSMI